MDKSEVIINELESYISTKENKKECYTKFKEALVHFNDMKKDEDLLFLKDVIDSNLHISLEDVDEYTKVVNYFNEKEKVRTR